MTRAGRDYPRRVVGGKKKPAARWSHYGPKRKLFGGKARENETVRDGPCRPNLIETYLDDCIMGFYTGGVLHFNSPTERKDVWRLGFCAPRLFLVRQRRRSLQHRKREAFHLVDELCGACAAGSRPATHLFSCRGIPCLCHHRCFVIASSLSFWKGPARRKGGRCLFFFCLFAFSRRPVSDCCRAARGRFPPRVSRPGPVQHKKFPLG